MVNLASSSQKGAETLPGKPVLGAYKRKVFRGSGDVLQ